MTSTQPQYLASHPHPDPPPSRGREKSSMARRRPLPPCGGGSGWGVLGARCHSASLHSSSTQVSLVPPPWLELTTSEPSRSATRVSPPGTICTSLPDSTKGLRSTWRGAPPLSTKGGPGESARGRCAREPRGRA